jgi:gamma-glutamyltranspeptidase/glutathione hydrolase
MKVFRHVVLLILVASCGGYSARGDTPVLPATAGGVVSSASPEATRAGVEMLDAGGNAVDAAVAVAFALAVTEPAMSGLGAGMQMLVQSPGKPAFVINGTSFAPAATPPVVKNPDSTLSGHRVTTIPTAVATLDYALRTRGSGTVSWAHAIAPAVRYAERGFEVGPFRAKVYARHEADLRASASARVLFLRSSGVAPAVGDTLRQPVLARTLARIAAGGADAFYRGDIAREIAADMAANGGWITLADLARVRAPREHAALHSTYRGHDIATVGLPASGWVVLQALNVLERSAPADLALHGSTRAERVVEALLAAHTSRRDNPILDLLNFEREAAQRISKAEAARVLGLLRGRDRQSPPSDERDEQSPDVSPWGETTHFTVVDANGMIVSVTASINAYFGSRVATPTLGFLYNDYMREFELDRPDHPYAIGPGRMPFSSMSASIASRHGVPVMGVGSPGSARIISAVTQVIQLWVDGARDIAGAVAAPRWHVQPPRSLYIEDSTAAATHARDLEQRFGLRLQQPADDLASGGRNPYFGGVHAVAWERDRWVGAADPRRDGTVGRSSRLPSSTQR